VVDKRPPAEKRRQRLPLAVRAAGTPKRDRLGGLPPTAFNAPHRRFALNHSMNK
jgi:hypothetical protein